MTIEQPPHCRTHGIHYACTEFCQLNFVKGQAPGRRNLTVPVLPMQFFQDFCAPVLGRKIFRQKLFFGLEGRNKFCPPTAG
jgi:hypothetical protein